MVELHGYCVAALELYKDKMVEINTGESVTSLEFADYTVSQRNILRGTLVGAIGDALVIKCQFGKQYRDVIVNVWAIICMAEMVGSKGGEINEIYIDDYRRMRKK